MDDGELHIMNGNETDPAIDYLDCPVYTENSDFYIEVVGFWVEGVLQTLLAIPGILGEPGYLLT